MQNQPQLPFTPAEKSWITAHIRDPISSLSHLVGALLALPGLFWLLKKATITGSTESLISAAVFGLSLICLYTASGVYHYYNGDEKIIAKLQRVDHMMIFLLIAGTYTPVSLLSLTGWWKIGIFVSVWLTALIGIILKIFFFDMPRYVSTLIYILMGWIGVIALVPLSRTLGIGGLFWLFSGGILYTVGGIIYALKRPRIISNLIGFHEIFHFFILAGSFSHYWMVYQYVL